MGQVLSLASSSWVGAMGKECSPLTASGPAHHASGPPVKGRSWEVSMAGLGMVEDEAVSTCLQKAFSGCYLGHP